MAHRIPLTILLLLAAFWPAAISAEWVVYQVGGTITGSTVTSDPRVGQPYTLDMVYTTDVTGSSGFYSDAILSVCLVFDARTIVLAPGGGNELRVLAGDRFEQVFAAQGRVLTDFSTGANEADPGPAVSCEVVLDDADGQFPVSTTPPLSLDLADFETAFVTIFLAGEGTLSCSITDTTFSTTDPAEMLEVEGPFFESCFDAGLPFPYRDSTSYIISSAVQGFPVNGFATEDLASWQAIGSEPFYDLLGGVRVETDFAISDSPQTWPQRPREFLLLQHPSAPAP